MISLQLGIFNYEEVMGCGGLGVGDTDIAIYIKPL